MNQALSSPAFGQADLTNCERELIHLAGSIQPHGMLLVLKEGDFEVLQASANSAAMLGIAAEELLGGPLRSLGGDIEAQLRRLADEFGLNAPRPFRCLTRRGHFEGVSHRIASGGIIVELEPITPANSTIDVADLVDQSAMQSRLATAVQQFSSALNIASLSETVVHCFRDMAGYDRVMVYKFDPDGHGEIIAEARDARLDSFLGHHYPASDIPQRARELYLRNRVRVLADVNYAPTPIVPRRFPPTGEELDMSLCSLRSMSPLHIQYLKNMGVTATLVVSLVREGRLWGLIACHHYSPRVVRHGVRVASDLLGEVISTRIAAIEDYAHAQVAVLVRRLEQRLVEATSTEGDWRFALFKSPRTLLAPLSATGAALFFEGEILTAGEVPSTPELQALADWVAKHTVNSVFSCTSIAGDNPALSSLSPTASGVLAVELSVSKPEYLMWFRKEQLCTVTWAGDPTKPVAQDNPFELSPRRSFAAWSEIVRGTAVPWSKVEMTLASAIGAALGDIILQIQAVRLLIAQHQLHQVQSGVENSKEPVILADPSGRVLFANEAFSRLIGKPAVALTHLDDVAALFSEPARVSTIIGMLRQQRQPWRGELAVAVGDADPLPVGVRADAVLGQQGSVLGFILIFTDLTDSKKAEAARRHLERSLYLARHSGANVQAGYRSPREPDEVIGAILANASVAALDIAEGNGSAVAPLLEELEASTQRAAALYRLLRSHLRRD